MGVHEVNYSIVVILGMDVGLFAPPDDAIGRIWSYILALALALTLTLAVALVVVAAFPWLLIRFLLRLRRMVWSEADAE